MARLFQDTREKRTHGARAAPWWVEWRESGKRRSKRLGSKADAKEFKNQVESKAGELQRRRKGLSIDKRWSDFRAEYEEKKLPAMRSARSREKARQVLDTFEATSGPAFVRDVDKQLLDSYVAVRLKSAGKKKGDTLSPETVRSELRTIAAALAVAVDWHYLPHAPGLPKVRGIDEDKPFVTAEHFDRILSSCEVARMPRPGVHAGQHFSAADWWRGLLATAWATGMRIGALLAIRWQDVDLDAGIVVSRGRNNKGKRDQRHQVAAIVEFLKPLQQMADPRVFPWNHNRRTLDLEFHRIQESAVVHLPCPRDGQHECTDACHYYGFHSLRYAHATYNYGRVTDRELQQQMGHASFETTKHYIKFAEQHQPKAYDVYLPGSLRAASGAV